MFFNTNWGAPKAPHRIIARGFTYPGIHHRRINHNNQDAFATAQSDHVVAAVVADGCGSGKESEVGSNLIVRWLAPRLVKLFDQFLPQVAIEHAKRDIIYFLSSLTDLYTFRFSMEKDATHTVQEFILNQLRFTLWVVVVKDGEAWIMFAGDGGYKIDNNNIIPIEQNNDPIYPVYALKEFLSGTRYEHYVTGEDSIFTVIPLGYHGDNWNKIAIMVDGAIPMWNSLIDPLFDDARVKFGDESEQNFYQNVIDAASQAQFISNKDDMTAVIIEGGF